MIKSARRLGFVLVVAIALGGVWLRAAEKPTKQAEFDAKIAKFVANYCVDCHGPKKQSGSMSLHQYKSPAEMLKDHVTWETVVERVRGREMPPKNKKQPSDAERNEFVNWLEAELSTALCTGPPPAGRVTLRRLNRVEYNNTIRDLFGMELNAGAGFPNDDVGYGFDNIGDVLSLSPLHLEKFMTAADIALEKVFAKEAKIRSTTRMYQPRELERSTGGRDFVLPEDKGRVLSFGELSRVHKFEHGGEYSIKLRAAATPVAGGENPRLALRIDGKEVGTFEVKPPKDGAVPNRKNANESESKVQVDAGPHRFMFALLNPELENDKKLERSVYFADMIITGPLNPPPPEPTVGYRKVMIAQPNNNKKGEEVARTVLTAFARRAYRRPASDAEIATLLKLYKLATKQGDGHDEAIKLALKAVLVSPNFLFKVENDPPKSEPGQTHLVSELELATRLAYFLWSSMPDDELLRLAQFAELRKPDVFEKQVRRMIGDPKSRALADNFAGQWLQTRSLRQVAIDEKQFPAFDDELRRAMVEETMQFFDHLVHEDYKITDFLDADFTYVNERLAKHYGIPGVRGPEFRRVSLKGTQRAGVLTHGSILTVTSNPTRTSPVKRGKFIMESILGATVPPPPPDVPELEDDRELKGSLRQKLELHRTNANCAVCHERMDPLGLAFENFDAVGVWRTTDGPYPIDPSGKLPDGKEFKNLDDLRRILKEKQDAFRKTLADRLLTYALGRGLEIADRCTVDQVCQKTVAGGDRFSALLMAVVTAEPFQKRTVAKGAK